MEHYNILHQFAFPLLALTIKKFELTKESHGIAQRQSTLEPELSSNKSCAELNPEKLNRSPKVPVIQVPENPTRSSSIREIQNAAAYSIYGCHAIILEINTSGTYFLLAVHVQRKPVYIIIIILSCPIKYLCA